MTPRQERVNVLAYIAQNTIVYLAAPVLYVDVVHAGLCDKLGASKFVANLPTAMAVITSLIPLFIAWAFPRTGQIKPVLLTSDFLAAALGLTLSVALWLP